MTTGNPGYQPNDPASMYPNSDPNLATGSNEQSTGGAVKQKAGQVADQAQQMVSQATDQAQQQAKSQIATRKDQAAGNLTDVSQAVSQVGSQLRQNDHDTLAQYADMAAQQVSRAASYLQNHSVNDLLDDVQGLARRQPAVFLVGALALGVLGARFLKSSSPQSGSRYNGGRYNTSPSGYRQRSAGQYRGQYRGAPQSGYYDPYGRYGATNRDWREVPENLRGSQRDQGASYSLDDPNAQTPSTRGLGH